MLYDKKWDVRVEPKLEPWRLSYLAAAQYIRDHGWCQNKLRNGWGQVCVLGALTTVSPQASYHHLREYLYNTEFGSIADWNNAPGRTKEQVIAALEGAAKQGA